MRYGNWTKLLVGALLLSACGKELQSPGSRGYLGQESGTPGLNDTNTTVQSSGGISCTATPSQSLVTSGQQFSLQITISGATGNVAINGYAVGAGVTSAVLNMTFTTTSPTPITVPGTSVTVADQTGAYYKCPYTIQVVAQ